MDELDRRIAEALADDDLGLPGDAREPGFFALAFSTMRGPQGWVTWVLMVVQTVMFLAAVWPDGTSLPRPMCCQRSSGASPPQRWRSWPRN